MYMEGESWEERREGTRDGGDDYLAAARSIEPWWWRIGGRHGRPACRRPGQRHRRESGGVERGWAGWDEAGRAEENRRAGVELCGGDTVGGEVSLADATGAAGRDAEEIGRASCRERV